MNDAEVKAAIEAEAKKLSDAEIGGLKKQNATLMDELKPLKELKQKAEGIDLDKAREWQTKQKTEGEKNESPEQLRAKIEAEFKPLVDAAKQEAADAKAKLDTRTIDSDLTSALVEANVAKDLMPAAKALLREGQEIEVTESGATVDGKPIAQFVKEWIAKDGKAFVAAGQHTGGGANGNRGGGANTGQKRSQMSRSEKTKFIAAHGHEAYLALPLN